MTQRYFFHSFPRPRANENAASTLERGLRILNNIHENGLVLSTEQVTWKQPTQGDDRIVQIPQTRACFTELSLPELNRHAVSFGPISIEFELSVLRNMGAIPVIYIPQALQEGLSALGASIVAQLGDAEYTLRLLHSFDQFRDPNYCAEMARQQGYKDVLPSIPESVNVKIADDKPLVSVPMSHLGNILDAISYKNAPFDMMANILSAIQSLFYHTDDERHSEILSYYRQREWRIISGIGTVDGGKLDSELSNAEKFALMEDDPRFWGRIVTRRDYEAPRVEWARIIRSVNGHPFHFSIRKVYVPAAGIAAATTIFGDKVMELT